MVGRVVWVGAGRADVFAVAGAFVVVVVAGAVDAAGSADAVGSGAVSTALGAGAADVTGADGGGDAGVPVLGEGGDDLLVIARIVIPRRPTTAIAATASIAFGGPRRCVSETGNEVERLVTGRLALGNAGSCRSLFGAGVAKSTGPTETPVIAFCSAWEASRAVA